MADDKIAQFDPSKRKPGGISVDLDAPFFTRRREPLTDYTKCDHTRLGFEYDVKHRKVYCRCGEEVDSFDAIVALAQAEQRLQHTREVIEAEARKKAGGKGQEAVCDEGQRLLSRLRPKGPSNVPNLQFGMWAPRHTAPRPRLQTLLEVSDLHRMLPSV